MYKEQDDQLICFAAVKVISENLGRGGPAQARCEREALADGLWANGWRLKGPPR